ncbi:MAG: hypothetical protein OHK0048_03900 [Rhodoferax sp.]
MVRGGVLALGVLVGLALGRIALQPEPAPLLLAPMFELDPCLLADRQHPNAATANSPWAFDRCQGPLGSAAHWIESTLTPVERGLGPQSQWQLGYTLKVPLLALWRKTADGWALDREAIAHVVNTVRETPRPVVLYAFSTHFATGAPLEAELAKDPANMAELPSGPMGTGQYFGQPIYPWSVARTDTPLTQVRSQTLRALADALCTLPEAQRSKIAGITLLGEVHQQFPDFEHGMGFALPYQVSDYSAASVHAFRAALRQQFGSIAALNRALGSDFSSFDAIHPPRRNIRTEPLNHFFEHIDSFAAGSLPIAGWVYAGGPKVQIRIFLDGHLLTYVHANRARQDVAAAHPEWGTAQLGWRHDLDFRGLAPGVHQIAVQARSGQHGWVALGQRSIVIMDRQQSAPVTHPTLPLPPTQPMPTDWAMSVDEPQPAADYYFNPLARLWQDFRAEQVRRYLDHFENLLASSCLANTPRYTHQILPQTNPGWDADKFAAQRTLQARPSPRAGWSLYGSATQPDGLLAELRHNRVSTYAATEFHPLDPWDAATLRDNLRWHHAHGARFVSFFLESRAPDGQRLARLPNPFAWDADNPRYHGQTLWHALTHLDAHAP